MTRSRTRAIDQTLLGHTYQVIMPMTVIKVKDGYMVENTATQVTNDKRDKTNTVTNPLKHINPTKDVTVQVGGDSIDGKSVYKDHTFLYRSTPASCRPPRLPDRSRLVGRTSSTPRTTSSRASGPCTRAATCTGTARSSPAKGEKIAGSGFDSSKFGGDLFTVDGRRANGKVTTIATEAYLDWCPRTTSTRPAGALPPVQAHRRGRPVTRTRSPSIINGQPRESNIVWTRTPDMTPSIHIEKSTRPPDGQEQATATT